MEAQVFDVAVPDRQLDSVAIPAQGTRALGRVGGRGQVTEVARTSVMVQDHLPGQLVENDRVRRDE